MAPSHRHYVCVCDCVCASYVPHVSKFISGCMGSWMGIKMNDCVFHDAAEEKWHNKTDWVLILIYFLETRIYGRFDFAKTFAPEKENLKSIPKNTVRLVTAGYPGTVQQKYIFR